jgi:hypothetical protein
MLTKQEWTQFVVVVVFLGGICPFQLQYPSRPRWPVYGNTGRTLTLTAKKKKKKKKKPSSFFVLRLALSVPWKTTTGLHRVL